MSIKSNLNNQQGIAVIIIALLGLIILGGVAGGGYYYMTVANKPAVVKQTTETLNPAVKDLSRSIMKLHDNVVDSPSGNDPDSYERYAKASEDATDLAKKDLEAVKTATEKIKISEMNDYKNALTKYSEKSQELVSIGEENTRIAKSTISISRDYQAMTKDLSGVSGYMYSDPARYVKEIRNGVAKERQIIKDAEAIEVTGAFKDSHKLNIEVFKIEADFLEAMATAVENRDNAALTSSQKEYASKTQDLAEDYNRTKDTVDKLLDDLKSDLEDLKDTVDEEYDQLKSQYKI